MTRDEEFIPTIAVAEMSGTLNGMLADDANKLFIKFLSDISKQCGTSGALAIGHNKANFKSKDDLLSISCTTEDGNVRSKCVFANSVDEYYGVINIIVYGLEYDVLKNLLISNASNIPGCKISVVEEGGCDDPECNNPNCNDPNHKRKPITIEGL